MDYAVYEATNADGNILMLINIIESNDLPFNDSDKGVKGPVLLHHGYGTDGTTWLQTADFPSPTFPERLFNDGYDVWVAFGRGTIESRAHTTLDADENATEYWDFGVEDLAKVDIPTFITEILTVR